MTARFSTTTTAAVDDSPTTPYERVAEVSGPDLALALQPQLLAPTVTLEKLMYRRGSGARWMDQAGADRGRRARTPPPPSARSPPGAASPSRTSPRVGSPTLAECRGTALCASYDFADALFGVSGGIFSGEEPWEDAGCPRRLAQVTARPGTRAAMSLAVAEGPRRAARGVSMGAAGLFAVGERTLLSAWASTVDLLFGPYADPRRRQVSRRVGPRRDRAAEGRGEEQRGDREGRGARVGLGRRGR